MTAKHRSGLLGGVGRQVGPVQEEDHLCRHRFRVSKRWYQEEEEDFSQADEKGIARPSVLGGGATRVKKGHLPELNCNLRNLASNSARAAT